MGVIFIKGAKGAVDKIWIFGKKDRDKKDKGVDNNRVEVEGRKREYLMKILSQNVRGLGGKFTWRAIRECLIQEEVKFACFQETKMESVSKQLCSALWGDGKCEWRESLAINLARGLLCIWSKEVMKVTMTFIGKGYMGVQRVWTEGNISCIIINIYAPCKVEEKRRQCQQVLC